MAHGHAQRVVIGLGLGLASMLACRAEGRDDPYACIADEGPRLVVTTTDFSTGAVTVVDVDDRCVQRDVALAGTDAIPFVHEGLVYAVNRYQADYVDVLDPDADWALIREQAITAVGTESANPRALAFGPDGLAWVALYGAPELQLHDLEAGKLVDTVDLSAFADADGTTECPLAVVHGGILYLFVERLDRTAKFVKVDDDIVLAVDLGTREILDLDEDEDGVQGFALLGRWPRQWRDLPGAPGQGLVLSSGVQRVDLAAHTTSWVIDESEMAAAGIDAADLPQSFDVDAQGRIWIAAYTADFGEVRILRSGPDGALPLEVVVGGLDAVERTLEIVGDEIWFGDTTAGAPGMRAFSFDGTPLLDEAIPTGLPPYSIARLD